MENLLPFFVVIVIITQLPFMLNTVAKRIKTHHEKKKFHIELDDELSWPDAYQFCKFHGMRLATIHTKSDQHDLEAALKKENVNAPHKMLWLSGTKFGNKTYSWMSSAKRVIHHNWEKNYPSESNCTNMCLAVSFRMPAKWKDYPCSKMFPFVCEYHNLNQ